MMKLLDICLAGAAVAAQQGLLSEQGFSAPTGLNSETAAKLKLFTFVAQLLLGRRLFNGATGALSNLYGNLVGGE
jgi:hypothetical protein